MQKGHLDFLGVSIIPKWGWESFLNPKSTLHMQHWEFEGSLIPGDAWHLQILCNMAGTNTCPSCLCGKGSQAGQKRAELWCESTGISLSLSTQQSWQSCMGEKPGCGDTHPSLPSAHTTLIPCLAFCCSLFWSLRLIFSPLLSF